MKLYRRVPFGRLAEFSVLDTRQYRNHRTCDAVSEGKRIPMDCPERLDASRSLLGPTQEAWLQGQFAATKAKWNVLAQQYLMEQFMTAIGKVGKIDSPRGTWEFNDNGTPRQLWYLREVKQSGDGLANVVISELGELG